VSLVKELELKLAGTLSREQRILAELEAERERCSCLIRAIEEYLYELDRYPESARSKQYILRIATTANMQRDFARGQALYALYKALDDMGADSLSLEVLAALSVLKRGGAGVW
jgi:hypothetical protein